MFRYFKEKKYLLLLAPIVFSKCGFKAGPSPILNRSSLFADAPTPLPTATPPALPLGKQKLPGKK